MKKSRAPETAGRSEHEPQPMIRRFSRSLGARLFVGSLLWVSATLVIGGLVLALAFERYVEEKFDARLLRSLDAMVGAAEIDELGAIRFTRPLDDPRYAEPYSGHYWQVAARDRPVFRSRSLWDHALEPHWEVPASRTRLYEEAGPTGEPLRIAARDIELPDADTTFRFMVAADTREMRADIAAFRRLILISLSAFGAALALAILIQLVIAMRPLRAIRRGLSAIRSGRAQRLEGSFPTEVEGLIDEVNALITHNEELVERARRHAGNLAHALKTPLTVLANEASGTKADGAGEAHLARVVSEQVEVMRRHMDHHLKRARIAGSRGIAARRTPVRPAVERLVRAMRKIHGHRRLVITCEVPEDLAFRGQRQDLEEMVGNLLDNACKWAHGRVRVSARPLTAAFDGEDAPARLEIRVEDDGPGVPEEKRAALFERGRRLDESLPGSGLGLSIVMDIAELHGGRVRLSDSAMGGLAVHLELPALPPATR